ncbi:MAG: FemAB family PEP-CTERM system-associated protein [Fibrobacter sp.]|nr:FemAB family PEP-CTERM system-associated protein [Fibrobacter sp.]
MLYIMPLHDNDSDLYDEYVRKHPLSTLYHLFYFKKVIENTYHHRSFYQIALDERKRIVGVLPVFYFRSIFLGDSLISLPFCDYGGILADSAEVYAKLFNRAIELCTQLKSEDIELRQTEKINFSDNSQLPEQNLRVNTGKVRMTLELPDTSDALFASFPAKLRSQIRKPQKEGCYSVNGGIELLDDFYDVFTHNMRDLGSPVHSRSLMKNMLIEDPLHTRIFVVYHDKIPVACSLVGGYKDVLVNPWASFKRSNQKIAPNMMLYWEMLRFAIENNYRHFDFGRSTPDEGTYKFKAQWGAVPHQLYWYSYNKKTGMGNPGTLNSRSTFIRVWQKLPLAVTRAFGPVIRRGIHL